MINTILNKILDNFNPTFIYKRAGIRVILAIFLLISLCYLVVIRIADGYVASSTNYRIERDSINFSGKLSTSTSYGVEDTLGEVSTGLLTSTSYRLEAGYQQNEDYVISITSPSDVTLSPSIDGAVGGTADGSAAWTVTTNNPTGYLLTIQSSTNPAMKSSSASFADYTTALGSPDYTWSVSASASEFGYTPEGTEIATAFLDNGSTCGVGALDTGSACWEAATTSARSIATRASNNNPSGTATTIRFRATAGSSANQAAGTYVATLTLTASTL